MTTEPTRPPLRIFEIDDGEKHIVAAKDEHDAVVCAFEGLGMTKQEWADECGDEPLNMRELNLAETVRVRYDTLQDLRLLFEKEECPIPVKIELVGAADEIIRGRGDSVYATFQVLLLTHSKRGLISSTVY